MPGYQQLVMLVWFVYTFSSLILGSYHNFKRGDPFGFCRFFSLSGSFVWADAVVFGSFWSILTLYLFYLHNWLFFLISLTLFWLVRSLGETIYWFNQQFSTVNLNPPESLFFSGYFPKNSIWFVYQIFYQCITVLSGLALVYLLKIYFVS